MEIELPSGMGLEVYREDELIGMTLIQEPFPDEFVWIAPEDWPAIKEAVDREIAKKTVENAGFNQKG